MARIFDYNTIVNEGERREKALHDLKQWLGKQYKKATDIALEEKAKGVDRQQIVTSMSIFLGIEGYPVTVWLDFLGYPPATPKITVQ